MKESDIEDKVCKYARALGWEAYKFTSPSRRNVPDRLMVTPFGYMFFIEFKAPGKKPTAGQEREIARLEEKGVMVWVVDDVDEGKDAIAEIHQKLKERR